MMMCVQPLVRRQHNSGFKHKANVKAYYLQYEEEAQMRLMAEVNGFEMVRFCDCRAGLASKY